MSPALGFTPKQMDEMSLFELMCCIDGWKALNGVKDEAQLPSDDELRDWGIAGF